jgi:hypothetical protein
MTSLDSLIDYTKISQDAELAAAFSVLKSDPAKMTQFLQQQQTAVYDQIMGQKETSFDKVYGDLNRSAKVQETMLMYNKRNGELKSVRDQVFTSQKEQADAILNDKQLSARKNEMNEWTFNNKRDTLFVFSSLFIMLCGFILITVMWRMGLISSYVWGFLGVPMIVIFVLIVVRRSLYTDTLRNKRFWNKKIFEGKVKQVMPSECESPATPVAAPANGVTPAATGIPSVPPVGSGAAPSAGMPSVTA